MMDAGLLTVASPKSWKVGWLQQSRDFHTFRGGRGGNFLKIGGFKGGKKLDFPWQKAMWGAGLLPVTSPKPGKVGFSNLQE